MGRLERAIPLLLGLAFVPALVELAHAWTSVSYQSQGFLVPVVAAWLAWRVRGRLRRLPQARDLRALPLVAAALALYVLGLAIGSASLDGVALVGAVAGCVWLLLGARWLRALAFPLGFLVFLIPLPEDWVTPIVVQLQLLVSHAAVGVLQRAGVTVAREGNVIVLPGGTLFVAEACSGITSVVTLVPLAALVAYLLRLSLAASALVLVAVLPTALIANLARVIGTVLAARAVGVDAVTRDPVHTAAGLAVYAVGCSLLVALARAVSPHRAGGGGAGDGGRRLPGG
jgi:exosortase